METAITLRPLEAQDRARSRALMAQAFERGRVVKEENSTEEKEGADLTTGIFEGEELCAALTIRPFLLHWPGAVNDMLSMGGIAGVATQIEARGRGHVDRLLRDALVRMRDAGQTISALNPFAWAFYRRFGWDWVGEERTITLPLRELPAAPAGKRVRRIPSEEAERLLAPVYDAYGARYRGMFGTEFHQWTEKLAHSGDRTTYVYAYFPEGSDTPTAYLLWRYKAEGDGGDVREFVATTPEDYRGLLSLLHYLGTQCRTATLTVPADSPLWSYLYHWEVETKVRPVFMGRVVDVAAACSQLTAPAGLPEGSTVTIGVQDSAAPWNNGVFLLTAESGRIHARLAPDTPRADITLDIQALSQAFWGFPSLTMLRDAGRLTMGSDSGFAMLDKILPPARVFTRDFF